MSRRRKYDEKFKEDAVHLLLNGDKTLREVADNLGVERSCLGRWRKEYLEELDGGVEKMMGNEAMPSELERENRQLRKELSSAIQEREILKKAIGIFSRSPGKHTGS